MALKGYSIIFSFFWGGGGFFGYFLSDLMEHVETVMIWNSLFCFCFCIFI